MGRAVGWAEGHLRQWYVLADVMERSGELGRPESFRRIAAGDPDAYDVAERLDSLGSTVATPYTQAVSWWPVGSTPWISKRYWGTKRTSFSVMWPRRRGRAADPARS